MAKRIATLKGRFLVPGVSRNGRKYTRENIAKAVSRMQEALATPDGMPLSMATGHGAAHNDDALAFFGKVTRVSQAADGSAHFEADVADTAAGRDIAALSTGGYLKSVSIRGQWMSEPYEVTTESGENATTADDLAVVGIDFTGRPGVEGAEITHAELAESVPAGMILESVDEVHFEDVITEAADPDDVNITKMLWDVYEMVKKIMMAQSMEMDDPMDAEVWSHLEDLKGALKNALVDQLGDMVGEESATDRRELLERGQKLIAQITESGKAPYGNVTYADPGYQKDKQKRYPIDTEKHVRAAWSYINQSSNAESYSPAQLARIKSRIKSAAKKFNIDIASESAQLISELTEVLEAYSSGAAAPLSPKAIERTAQDWAYSTMLSLAEGNGGVFGGETDGPSIDGNAAHSNCMQCGGMLDDSAMYCPMCGQPVEQVGLNGPSASDNDDTNMEATVPNDTEIAAEEAAPVAEAPAAATETAVVEEANATPVTAPKADLSEGTIKTLAEATAVAVATALADILKPAAPAAVAEETPAAEEVAPVAEAVKTYTAEEVLEIANAAKSQAATEAIEAFRAGPGARKGLVSGSVAHTAGELSEGGELDARSLAEMSSAEFLRLQEAVWAKQPYRFAGDMTAQPGVVAPV